MENTTAYIPEHALLQIFKYMDPVSLVKLRSVSSSWKNLIENECKLWRQLVCTTTEIKPWSYQLIKMKYPSMSSDFHDQLNNDQFRELFELFIEWRKIYKNECCQVNLKIPGVQFLDWESRSNIVTDSLDKHIAIASLSEPVRIFLADISSIESQENLLELTSIFGDIIYNDISDQFHIKLWRPLENKLFIIIKSNNTVLIFDVNENKFIKIPKLLKHYDECDTIICRGSTDIYFGFENFGISELAFVKCQYDEVNCKINDEVILIIEDALAQRIIERPFRFQDMTVSNKTIIIAYHVRAHTRMTIVDFSEAISLPLTIDMSDKKYTRKIFKKNTNMVESNSTFICTAAPVVIYKREGFDLHIAVARKFFSPSSEFPSLVAMQRTAVHTLMNVVMIKLHFSNLYLITDEGQLRIYKLKNLEHFKHLNFDRLNPKVIELNIRVSAEDMYFLERNKDPIIVISRNESPIILLHFHSSL